MKEEVLKMCERMKFGSDNEKWTQGCEKEQKPNTEQNKGILDIAKIVRF